MNKLVATMCSAALLSASAAAVAMDDMKEDSMKMMMMMDTNHDGMISKTEFMNHQTMMWEKMKKNKDGMVIMKDMKMMDMGGMHDDGMKMDTMKK